MRQICARCEGQAATRRAGPLKVCIACWKELVNIGEATLQRLEASKTKTGISEQINA